ncbi:MAG: hypothetical protein QOJ03_278, partial [Frankiaceae bacterium]|nr:hypothetical protein [Frankiaceae bacterium]
MRTPTRSAVLRFLDARAPVLIRLLVAAVGATPLVWFHYDQMLKTVDSFFPVHFLCCDTSGFFSWDARVGTGLPTNLAPIAVFDYVVSWFATHVSVSLAEAGTLALLGSLAAVGMALLAEELIRVLQKDSRRLAPLIAGGIAGVFWVVNPFALSYVWYHTLFLEATWAEIHRLLYVLLRATRSGWSLTRTLLTTLAI